jgi:ABC-type branched-subunit amino acid transport system ATPase component
MSSATELDQGFRSINSSSTGATQQPPARLEIRGLAKHFGGVRVFSDVSFEAPAGQITALVGPNGAGKTTLINIVCGVISPGAGDILKDGSRLLGLPPHAIAARGIARTFQDVRVFPTLTVEENVLVALPAQPGDSVWRLFRPGWREAERRNREIAMDFLARVGLADVMHRPAEDIPFGSQKLLGLARAIATGADTLLLDESTTGLEVNRIPLAMQLFRDLRASGKTLLLIEHNMDVVADVADHVVVLHGTVIALGTAARVLGDQRVIREYLGRLYDA